MAQERITRFCVVRLLIQFFPFRSLPYHHRGNRGSGTRYCKDMRSAGLIDKKRERVLIGGCGGATVQVVGRGWAGGNTGDVCSVGEFLEWNARTM